MTIVKPLVRKNLTPVQDRSSFIAMRHGQGATYQEAVREYDRILRATNRQKVVKSESMSRG